MVPKVDNKSHWIYNIGIVIDKELDMAKTTRVKINVPTDNVFAAAFVAQRTNKAYIKAGQQGVSNRAIIEQILTDQVPFTDEEMAEGRKIRSYYQGLTFKILKGSKLNDFDNNAMLIANKDFADSSYDIAIIAALPSCYERAIKRDQLDQQIKFATGGFLANVGTKVQVTVNVVKSFYSQNYNVYFVTGLTDKDQPVFFSYKNGIEVGKTINIKGTVKAHKDNSTQLSRVKVV